MSANPSSLCARSCGTVSEDTLRVDIQQSTREGERVGGQRLATEGEVGNGPRVVTEASLCTGEDVTQLRSQFHSDLNIRPVQESNGRPVQVESVSNPLLSSGIVELRSNRMDERPPSETLAKNVTEPKTVDASSHAMGAAGDAGSLRDKGDGQMGLSLHEDPPSRRVDDVNLRSVSASHGSSHSTSETLLSSERVTQQPVQLMSDRRLSHSQSVPEADAILSPG